MIGREDEGPLWAVLGRSRGLCWRSWGALGACVGGHGPLLEPMWAVLAGSRGLCGWPGVALRPLWPVLGGSQGLCGRSWAVLGRKVALAQTRIRSGERIWAEKWAWPKRECDLDRWPGPGARGRSGAETDGDPQQRWERWDLPERSGGPVPIFL